MVEDNIVVDLQKVEEDGLVAVGAGHAVPRRQEPARQDKKLKSLMTCLTHNSDLQPETVE